MSNKKGYHTRKEEMRNQVRVIGLGVLLVTLCLSGCSEFETKTNQITVNVMAAVTVNMVDTNNNIIPNGADGVSVHIEMVNSGGQRLFFDRIVQGGLCQATGVIDFSKGQRINCSAAIQGSYQGFSPVGPDYEILSWDAVNGSQNIGGMYDWYPKLVIILR
jgi:hypothetical protein